VNQIATLCAEAESVTDVTAVSAEALGLGPSRMTRRFPWICLAALFLLVFSDGKEGMRVEE
jgi:hypothetical protein